MPFILSTVAQNAACDAIVDLIDTGTGTATLVIFEGTQPANPQTAHGSTALATFDLPDPCFGNAVAGVATANSIGSVTADATGTAQWLRVYDKDGVDPTDAVFDMDVGEGSGTANFDDVDFVVGGSVAITSFTVTVPAAGCP